MLDNWKKIKTEYRLLRKSMKPHVRRFVESFKNPRDITHAYVNLFVESRRISPYLTGHIDGVLYPAIFIICMV